MNKDTGATQQFVEISDIKNGTIILKGGGLRQVLMISGVNFDLKSEEEQDILLHAFQNFLNTLDYSLQIVVHSRKMNIDAYLDNLRIRADQEENELLKNQILEYIEFIKSFVQQNAVMAKIFFVVVSYNPAPIASAGGIFSGLFGSKPAIKKDNKNNGVPDENFQHNLIQINQRTENVVEGLSQIGLRAVALNDRELVELFYNFYNPANVEKKELKIVEQ